MKPVPDVLSFFSSITLHGLASSSANGDTQPLILHRNQSFPPKRYQWECLEECTTETDSEWESLPVSVGKAHAEFELLEQLSEGRMSFVYAARLLCLRQSPDGDLLKPDCMPHSLPEQFCIKLAKAEFIRSLARETWFYEQLAKEHGYQGVITPLCFGFFTSTLPSTLQIDAWSKMECKPHKHDHELVYDRYYDDDEEDSDTFTSDQRACRKNCPWGLKQWISRTDRSPVVGVLITERLGEQFPRDFGCGEELLLEESRDEINDILDDLSAVGIMHDDVKFNNLLRPASFSPFPSPSSSPSSASSISLSSSSSSSALSQLCPRHNRVHTWRIIDFDRSRKWGKSVPLDMKYFTETQRFEFRHGYFWGEPL